VVAVAVLAFAMGALISGMARYADQRGLPARENFGAVVAHNRLTEIDLEPAWPSVARAMATPRWPHQVALVRRSRRDTRSEVRRVNIRVQAQRREGDSAALSSFVSKSGRQ